MMRRERKTGERERERERERVSETEMQMELSWGANLEQQRKASGERTFLSVKPGSTSFPLLRSVKFLRLLPLSDPSNFACLQLLSDSSSLIAKRIAKEFFDCSSVRSLACSLLFFYFFSSLNLQQWTKFQKKSVAII
jgi:hypothetical protein